jgi:hypothetical protein
VIGGSGVDYVGTSYLLSSGITQGVIYTFRIKSANQWGWATSFSPSVQILAASVPAKVSQPITSYDPANGNVNVQWTQPNNHGSPLTAYKIEFLDASFVYRITSECDGSLSPVLSSSFCSVQMQTLTTLLSLNFQDLIRVRVSA